MEIKYLKHSIIKYMRFDVGVKESENKNFDELLIFIGKYNRIYKEKDNLIANAYIAIRKKTDELLGVHYKSDPLRTRKSEIKSIRKCFDKLMDRNHNLMKIPFKISFIFEAITLIVDDIRTYEQIPQNLLYLNGTTYRSKFYNSYYGRYMDWYNSDEGRNCRNDKAYIKENELYNDFNAEGSPFLKELKKEEDVDYAEII